MFIPLFALLKLLSFGAFQREAPGVAEVCRFTNPAAAAPAAPAAPAAVRAQGRAARARR